jgi:hypothetical protein
LINWREALSLEYHGKALASFEHLDELVRTGRPLWPIDERPVG